MGLMDGILNLVFPPRCIFCRGLLRKGEEYYCANCAESLPYTKDGAASTEGAAGLDPSSDLMSTQLERERALSDGTACSGDAYTVCVSPLYHEGVVRDSLRRFRFKDASAYAKGYGQMIADCVRSNLDGRYDLISWVPLSEARMNRRGYDQAMLIALTTALCLDDVAVETLIRHTDITAQSLRALLADDVPEEHASRAEARARRRASVSGVYRVADAELIAGKRILLIDDLVTTGSTLSECAATLLQAGAVDVICATLARSRD